MSDTYRRSDAIKRALEQCFPHLSGHRAQHLNTLVAMICGIVGSGHVHQPKMAGQAPGGKTQVESQVIRFRRWLTNDGVTWEQWMLPVAQALLAALAHQPLLLVMDGSTVGRGCMALMISVVYGGRALPIAWIVVKGKKGHLPQDLHRALLAQVQPIIPAEAQIVFLGDGEFDGIALQADIEQAGWQYVCRTARNILVTAFDCQFPIGAVPLVCGQNRELSEALITAQLYGPVKVLFVWEEGYEEPIYLLTNIEDSELALAYYRKRAHIETFFSDQKSRGFHIAHSHLSDPVRLSRLLIASCLAYLWVVYLGTCALGKQWLARIHRRDRCDLSLFQLGLRLLAYCLRETMLIPLGFFVPATPPTPPRGTN
jgi:hypothetical protein